MFCSRVVWHEQGKPWLNPAEAIQGAMVVASSLCLGLCSIARPTPSYRILRGLYFLSLLGSSCETTTVDFWRLWLISQSVAGRALM
jgi:hypothetical protein